MHYSIRHVTRFRYSAPIRESVMEVHLRPRDEGTQRCFSFELAISPRAHIHEYVDYHGNRVHAFDIPSQHAHLTITAESLVAIEALPPLPTSLPTEAWGALDHLVMAEDHWELLLPSARTTSGDLLHALARELNAVRRDDPLSLLRELNSAVYHGFHYVPSSTTVDSPIDDALRMRQGVCQDFAHIMIALVRQVGIPCRYVSGYLFHRLAERDRSVDDASHAWVEALLPGLGWVGFDPTNNLIAGQRHIRVAVGRDYDDVPPTRGVFKGAASSELGVSVQVHLMDATFTDQDSREPASVTYLPLPDNHHDDPTRQQQGQQQQ